MFTNIRVLDGSVRTSRHRCLNLAGVRRAGPPLHSGRRLGDIVLSVMSREEPTNRFAVRTKVPLRTVVGKLLASLHCLRDHWDRIDDQAAPEAERATIGSQTGPHQWRSSG